MGPIKREKRSAMVEYNANHYLLPGSKANQLVCETLSKILHQYSRITALTKLCDGFLAYLPYTLTCQTELVAYLLKTFLVATNTITLADYCYLTVLKHLRENIVQLESH